MTDEELQQTIQELDEDMDKLSDSDKPLTRKEKRRKQILVLKKETLQKIKTAREKHDTGIQIAAIVGMGWYTNSMTIAIALLQTR